MIDPTEQEARATCLKRLRRLRNAQRGLISRHRRLAREHASYGLRAEAKAEEISREIRKLEREE